MGLVLKSASNYMLFRSKLVIFVVITVWEDAIIAIGLWILLTADKIIQIRQRKNY